jgi:hypothetical protein
MNIHGAVDLEAGRNVILEALDVDANSTIRLLDAIQHAYKGKRRIHLFLDNARYHHAIVVQEWLKKLGCRIKLRFLPTYCPHLHPIERLWRVMNKNHHPQPKAQDHQRLRQRDLGLPAHRRATKMGHVPRLRLR